MKEKKKNGFIGEFKQFIQRGNVIDLAVGVIIGGAFQSIINSLVNDVFMPLISTLTGGLDFSNWFIILSFKEHEGIETLAQAQAAGLATLNYGVFISAIINFLIMAFVVFLLVKLINKVTAIGKKEEAVAEEVAPTTKKCPFCKSEIDIEAVKCPNCTSDVSEAEEE